MAVLTTDTIQRSAPRSLGAVVVACPAEEAPTNARLRTAVLELSKPRITRLVTITSGVGFMLGAMERSWQASEFAQAALGCIVGTALSSSGANALNQWWERARDARMPRTASRPLPERRISPGSALLSGVAMAVAGVLTLLFINGPASALVSLATVLWYLLLYTPLKPITPLNTLVGAIPGALPPVLGWAATIPAFGFDGVAGFSVLANPGPWCLFLLMVVWQIPHFLAIAWMYRDDYAAGGYRMMPIVDPSGRATATTILVWSVALLASTVAPAFIIHDRLSLVYTVIAGITGLAFIGLCVRLNRDRSRKNARKVFIASIIHLPVLLLVMVGDALVSLLA